MSQLGKCQLYRVLEEIGFASVYASVNQMWNKYKIEESFFENTMAINQSEIVNYEIIQKESKIGFHNRVAPLGNRLTTMLNHFKIPNFYSIKL